MNRMLKAVALALALAALAATVLAVTGAAAEEEEGAPGTLTAAQYPATLDGTDVAGQKNAFTLFGEEIVCPDSSYTAKIAAPTTEITVTPTYNNAQCSAGGGGHKVTVTMNGCDYKILIAGTTKTIYDNYYAAAEILCPPGKDIEIHKYLNVASEATQICKYTIQEQKGITGPKIQNEHVKEGTTGTIVLERAFRKIVATQVKTGILCKEEGTKTGELHLNITFKGTTNAGTEDPIWVSD